MLRPATAFIFVLNGVRVARPAPTHKANAMPSFRPSGFGLTADHTLIVPIKFSTIEYH
jgi:hypothetical protein